MTEQFEISPQKAYARLSQGRRAIMIDVREPEEFALACIEGAQFIPMQSVPAERERIGRLAEDGDLMVICHHGVRSLQVVVWLREYGVGNCFSVAGGIDRWSREIDPAVPRY